MKTTKRAFSINVLVSSSGGASPSSEKRKILGSSGDEWTFFAPACVYASLVVISEEEEIRFSLSPLFIAEVLFPMLTK